MSNLRGFKCYFKDRKRVIGLNKSFDFYLFKRFLSKTRID